ncbi:hypothetical protein NQZ68_029329 [Dissostichus eleginoides]|nr:hypothetical protein NQZ68_029329 [Dissostichus eleginoides]
MLLLLHLGLRLPSCGGNGAIAMWRGQQVPEKSLHHVERSPVRRRGALMHKESVRFLRIAPLMCTTCVWCRENMKRGSLGEE